MFWKNKLRMKLECSENKLLKLVCFGRNFQEKNEKRIEF